MVDASQELMLEILKDIQSKLSQHTNDFAEVKTELRAIRGHLHSIQLDVGNLYTITAQHDIKFDRIEKRLGLNEPAL